MPVTDRMRQTLNAIADDLEATGTGGRISVRSLLSCFGHKRRRDSIVSEVASALKDAGLRTSPDFGDIDNVSIDSLVEFELDSVGSEPPTGPLLYKQPDHPEDLDGLGDSVPWDDYPLDELLIRSETRTVHGVCRRIKQNFYIMNPDFQRDFIWSVEKQSRLIESVIMRIPLPVFYLAEDDEGKYIVVDGLQRLTTFQRFVNDKLRLHLPGRHELNRKRFSELDAKLQNRIEDCNLIFYIMDSNVPDRARLDIFERVNGGVALTRQQMRNCIYMGKGTRFLREQARSDMFRTATGGSLRTDTMRDREFINRFCAFQILGVDSYSGDMDQYLANCLRKLNRMDDVAITGLRRDLQRSLKNNYSVFGKHAFRKLRPGVEKRSVINASLWDVMSTGLARYHISHVDKRNTAIHAGYRELLEDEAFNIAVTLSTNDSKRVRDRFELMNAMLEEALGDQSA